MKIRTLLVEDHTIVRQGLKALLDSSPDIGVIGEAADGAEGVALAKSLDPDVVVMDLSLPGLHGTEALARIKKEGRAKVVVLSMHTAPEFVTRAKEAGCDGYVVKGADVAELATAIRSAVAGTPYFSRQLEDASPPSHSSEALARLSARERQVLQLIAEGNTSKAIATQLGISVHTVNAHRVNLMAKLNLHDAQGITRFAIRNNMIGSD